MPITITKFSGLYQLTATTLVNANIALVWDFFSRPENLSRLAPPDMDFKITSIKAEDTYAGQIIAYQIRLLPAISVSWVTEITHARDAVFFVDEQRFGPYAMWHHEHHFQERGQSTEMLDRVTYKLPFGWLGRLLLGRLIKQKVTDIFRYRHTAISQYFV